MSQLQQFTSESVSGGHPDKVADQVSDAILDALIGQDPQSRVAVETLCTTGLVMVAGEVTSRAYVEIPDLVRETVRRIGYTDAAMGFEAESCAVLTSIKRQAPEIAKGVDTGGAGDQGMMYGYACAQTPELMPLPIQLAHRLTARQAEARISGAVPGLRPDAKSQVTVEYQGARPVRVSNVVLSTQHEPRWTKAQNELRELVVDKIIRPVLGDWWHNGITLHINPTGSFEIGGPHGDTGVTGRKIIVDTYGGYARHGGGAFSGKDPTKVDRSAAYMARYVAKNIVAAGLATACEVQISYAIGVAEPTSVYVDCQGTHQVDPVKIAKAAREVFSLSPRGIIETLELRRPIYSATARNGHFGHAPTGGLFPWERTDKVDALKRVV